MSKPVNKNGGELLYWRKVPSGSKKRAGKARWFKNQLNREVRRDGKKQLREDQHAI